jgi:hypothetical protein
MPQFFAAYPHHIEDLGTGITHFLVFFDQATGGDIAYTGGLSAFRPASSRRRSPCQVERFRPCLTHWRSLPSSSS